MALDGVVVVGLERLGGLRRGGVVDGLTTQPAHRAGGLAPLPELTLDLALKTAVAQVAHRVVAYHPSS